MTDYPQVGDPGENGVKATVMTGSGAAGLCKRAAVFLSRFCIMT